MNKEELTKIAEHDDDKIKGLIGQIKQNFIYLGCLLFEFNQHEQYKKLCYYSFESYIENELHMSKSTAYNLINVYKRFGEGINLKPKFKDFTYSQLTEMVNVPENELVKYKPFHSVRKIKEIKRESKRLENNEIPYFIKSKMHIKLIGNNLDVWDDVRKAGACPAGEFINSRIQEMKNDIGYNKNIEYEIIIKRINNN